jgi:hypothetical protein
MRDGRRPGLWLERGLVSGEVSVQIVVMITRCSPHTPAAHTAVNTVQYSRTFTQHAMT